MAGVTGKGGKSGSGVRLRLASQMLLSVVLALAVVLLVNWLVARPGIRFTVDTTQKASNSMDPATTRILQQLPGEVTVDLFFRAERAPLTQLVGQVQSRTVQLLDRMNRVSENKLLIRQNDLTDLTAVQKRSQELRLRGLENAAVVSCEGQVRVVRLHGGLATIHLGNMDPNNYRPPSIQSFDAEVNLLKAILSVTRGERPKIYFTEGHGEPDPFETGSETLGVLESALREDGFVVHLWNPAEEPEVPEDAFILAMIGPQDRVSDRTFKAVDAFLAQGGRVLAAPHADPRAMKDSGIHEWLETHGIEVTEGTVMEPFPDPASGALITGQRSVFFPIPASSMKTHEIVQPFIDYGRFFVSSRSHGLRVKRQPEHGTGFTMGLFSSNKKVSWLDTVPLDYRHDAELEPIRGYDLAVVSEVSDLAMAGPGQDLERPSSRLMVFGSADFLYSALLESAGGGGSSLDLALNACNWLAGREWRVNISPKDPDLRVLPLAKIPNLSKSILGLLAALFLGGVIISQIRSRGGPKVHRDSEPEKAA